MEVQKHTELLKDNLSPPPPSKRNAPFSLVVNRSFDPVSFRCNFYDIAQYRCFWKMSGYNTVIQLSAIIDRLYKVWVFPLLAVRWGDVVWPEGTARDASFAGEALGKDWAHSEESVATLNQTGCSCLLVFWLNQPWCILKASFLLETRALRKTCFSNRPEEIHWFSYTYIFLFY